MRSTRSANKLLVLRARSNMDSVEPKYMHAPSPHDASRQPVNAANYESDQDVGQALEYIWKNVVKSQTVNVSLMAVLQGSISRHPGVTGKKVAGESNSGQ